MMPEIEGDGHLSETSDVAWRPGNFRGGGAKELDVKGKKLTHHRASSQAYPLTRDYNAIVRKIARKTSAHHSPHRNQVGTGIRCMKAILKLEDGGAREGDLCKAIPSCSSG